MWPGLTFFFGSRRHGSCTRILRDLGAACFRGEAGMAEGGQRDRLVGFASRIATIGTRMHHYHAGHWLVTESHSHFDPTTAVDIDKW